MNSIWSSKGFIFLPNIQSWNEQNWDCNHERDNQTGDFTPEVLKETLILGVEECHGVARKVEETWDTDLNKASDEPVFFLDDGSFGFWVTQSNLGLSSCGIKCIDKRMNNDYQVDADSPIPIYVVEML